LAAAPDVKTVVMHSSGNFSTLQGWACKHGLSRLKKVSGAVFARELCLSNIRNDKKSPEKKTLNAWTGTLHGFGEYWLWLRGLIRYTCCLQRSRPHFRSRLSALHATRRARPGPVWGIGNRLIWLISGSCFSCEENTGHGLFAPPAWAFLVVDIWGETRKWRELRSP
jgi:hypothetical protein